MNRLGVLVDLQPRLGRHDAAGDRVSEAPVIFSHSGARALADVPRNVPDDVLELVGRTGGVVMATFVPWFVTQEGADMSRAWWDEMRRLREAHPDDPDAVARGSKPGSRRSRRFGDGRATSPTTSITSARWRASTHIGVGGDYDGVPTMGHELADVSSYPLVFEELRSRGYTDEELRAIAGRNVLRVMNAAAEVAGRLGSRPPCMATIEALDGAAGLLRK